MSLGSKFAHLTLIYHIFFIYVFTKKLKEKILVKILYIFVYRGKIFITMNAILIYTIEMGR